MLPKAQLFGVPRLARCASRWPLLLALDRLCQVQLLRTEPIEAAATARGAGQRHCTARAQQAATGSFQRTAYSLNPPATCSSRGRRATGSTVSPAMSDNHASAPGLAAGTISTGTPERRIGMATAGAREACTTSTVAVSVAPCQQGCMSKIAPQSRHQLTRHSLSQGSRPLSLRGQERPDSFLVVSEVLRPHTGSTLPTQLHVRSPPADRVYLHVSKRPGPCHGKDSQSHTWHFREEQAVADRKLLGIAGDSLAKALSSATLATSNGTPPSRTLFQSCEHLGILKPFPERQPPFMPKRASTVLGAEDTLLLKLSKQESSLANRPEASEQKRL